MHREGQVGLGLRSQHTCGRVTRVVDQERVGVAFPVDRVQRVGRDRFERLIVSVRWIEQGVAMGEVELLVVDVGAGTF